MKLTAGSRNAGRNAALRTGINELSRVITQKQTDTKKPRPFGQGKKSTDEKKPQPFGWGF